MKKSLLIILLVATYTFGFSQQLPVTSQYMFNRMIYNPAYAGSNKQFGAGLFHRSQWLGIKGAPSTQIFSMDGPTKNGIGLGLNLANDHTGVTNQTDVLGNISYKIGESSLYAGVRAGFSYYQTKLTDAFVWQTEDPVFSQDIRSAFLPKFGVGFYYFDGLFYAGLSAPDLLIYDNSKIFTSSDGRVRSLKRNYILTGGYTHILNNGIQIEPSLFIKYHPSYPLVVTANCNVRFSETFLVGASYRVNNAFTGLVQLKVYDKIKVGYAFDIYQPNVRINYFGTHEVMVSYNLDIE